MDIATTMAAVNYFNIQNSKQKKQNVHGYENIQFHLILFPVPDKSGSILDTYIGKDCAVSLFNDMGGIKGKLMDVDAQWVKIETPKKGTQFINRNMIRSVNFENK